MNNELAAVQLSEGVDMKCACVLLLDTSGSMNGPRIEALNKGLKVFKKSLLDDDLARERVDLSVITFDSQINVVRDFATVDQFEPPRLTAQYQTFMGTAILEALDRINERKVQYRDNGVAYYRPWLFMITDGMPEGEGTDILNEAKEALKREQKRGGVHVFAVGVGDQVDLNDLSQIVGSQALPLQGLKFEELFVWLSRSLEAVSASQPDDNTQLPFPNWTSITS